MTVFLYDKYKFQYLGYYVGESGSDRTIDDCYPLVSLHVHSVAIIGAS